MGRFGVNGSDMLGATVTGNVIVRSGGNAYFQGQPALQIGNGGDGQNVGTVTDATVTDNTIINSVYDSIGFSTSTDTDLAGNTITSPWRNGIVISPPYYPAPTGNATVTGNSVTGLSSGMSAYSNDSSGFTATLSNNSWQTGSSEGPYGGTPAAVPGVVQAENYDTGGQGVAYNATSTNGTANSYRSDGIDLETTSDTGAGYDLGWTASGQWFRYTVNAASAGTYTVSFRVAAPSAVTDALHLSSASGAILSGNVSIPATGGWQNWSTVTATVPLAAGQQTLAVDQDNGGWNLNYMSFAGGGGGATSDPNLALNQPATASGYTQTYVPSNAVDGNTSTYWESTDNAFPQWFQVDLGSAQSISRIVMDLPPSTAWGTRTQTITVQGSTNGSTYTTLAASAGYTFNPATGNTVTVTFPAADVRYVMLTFTANTGWPAGQLSELQVFAS